MKQLIVYCHPNPASFCRGVMDTMTAEFKNLNQDLRIRDLYALHLDPVLRASDLEAFENGQVPRDIQIEQEHVLWAERIILIYPLWWTGLPALLKGYIDRVFSLNFAYTYDANGPRGLLTGKKIYMITTMGASVSSYEQFGLLKSMGQTIDEGIGGFCAMTVLGHQYFGSVPNSTDEERRCMLEEVKQIARQLAAAN